LCDIFRGLDGMELLVAGAAVEAMAGGNLQTGHGPAPHGVDQGGDDLGRCDEPAWTMHPQNLGDFEGLDEATFILQLQYEEMEEEQEVEVEEPWPQDETVAGQSCSVAAAQAVMAARICVDYTGRPAWATTRTAAPSACWGSAGQPAQGKLQADEVVLPEAGGRRGRARRRRGRQLPQRADEEPIAKPEHEQCELQEQVQSPHLVAVTTAAPDVQKVLVGNRFAALAVDVEGLGCSSTDGWCKELQAEEAAVVPVVGILGGAQKAANGMSAEAVRQAEVLHDLETMDEAEDHKAELLRDLAMIDGLLQSFSVDSGGGRSVAYHSVVELCTTALGLLAALEVASCG
jgi:hypothetical protein